MVMKYNITKIDPSILDIADNLDNEYTQKDIDQLINLLPYEIREKIFVSLKKFHLGDEPTDW